MEDLGECPFCGGRLAIQREIGAVSHPVPTCKTFDRLDALAFVTAARKKLEERRRAEAS